MTTYTIKAVSVTYGDDDRVSAVRNSFFKLVTADNTRLAFDAQGDTSPIPDVIMRATSGALYTTRLNGVALGPDQVLSIGTITWGNGNQTQAVSFYPPTALTNTETQIVLAGTALPNFPNPAAADAFAATVTGVSKITSGPFVPGTAFDPRSIKGFLSVTENDVITATRPGEWVGRIISSGVGNDRVTGLDDNERFNLGTGTDRAYGMGGTDTIQGFGGSDLIYGGAGNDSIFGGIDNDRLFGDADNDRVSGEAGADLVFGGTGNDSVFGGANSDKVWGAIGNDLIFGGAGNDSTIGGSGNDTIFGDAGDDRIWAGSGNDRVKGGGGADGFIFARGYDRDTITDFSAVDDTLYLSRKLGIATETEALAKGVQVGADVVFDFGSNDVLILLGVQKSDLSRLDFSLIG